MTLTVEHLPWDSEFFGFSVGRVDLDGGNRKDVTDALDDARASGVVCLYGSLDPIDLEMAYVVQELGFRFVECTIDLEHPTSVPTTVRPSRSVAREGTMDDVARLDEELTLIAPWSRFASDPRFGLSAARRMQQAWVERAARGDGGRMLVVSEDESGITGFSGNLIVPGQEPRIDLVATTKPGSGASQALITFSFDLFGPGRSWGGPLMARNMASLRFCENIGFRVHTPRYQYHCWLDELPGR